MAGPGTPFANLAVAVGTTLSVVLLGYVLGSLGVCDPQASKGLRGPPFRCGLEPKARHTPGQNACVCELMCCSLHMNGALMADIYTKAHLSIHIFI